ncbi:unnamed protein product [Ectocarpus sp. 6 AP-2014]
MRVEDHEDAPSRSNSASSEGRGLWNEWRLLNRSSKVFAAKAATVASIGGLLFGYDIGVTTPVLPQLQRDMGFSLGMQDMVVSTMVMGALAGSLAAGLLTDRLGRWLTIVLTDLTFIAGGVVLISATTPGGWRILFGLSAWLAAAQLVLMVWFMPRSPRWLLTQKRREEATNILLKIRNSRDDVETELRQIELFDRNAKGSLMELTTKWRIPLLVTIALSIFQQLGGQANVLNFNVEILRAAGFNAGAPAVVLGMVKVLSTIIAITWVDQVGRRPFLLWGAGGCTVSLCLLSMSFKIGQPLLSFLACCAMVSCYSLSFGPVTWLVTAEMFPAGVRGKALGIGQMGSFLGSLVASAFFLQLLDSMGGFVTFALFGSVALSSTVFVYALVPETNGKEPSEIASELHACVGCVSYEAMVGDEPSVDESGPEMKGPSDSTQNLF